MLLSAASLKPFGMLFPLNGGRRLAGNIVNYPVNAFNLIDNAVGDAAHQVIW